MEATDCREADLYAAAADFIRRHDLHPDPDAYLVHGYVGLFLRGWQTAFGAPLHLAAEWAVWTWLADDVLDQELRDATSQAANWLALALMNTVAGVHQPTPEDHAVVGALADLVGQTREVMPPFWWERYRRHLIEWIQAAHEKLVDYLQPGRTPTLRQYLTIRPPDGGMLLAAMWCELAEQCVTPDWNDPLVQSLLSAFSACGYLANDLAAGGADTFTALDALVRTSELPAEAARERVREQLHAEEHRFSWALTALRGQAQGAGQHGPQNGLSLDTPRFALHLELFWHALREWTTASSRYVLAAPEAAQ